MRRLSMMYVQEISQSDEDLSEANNSNILSSKIDSEKWFDIMSLKLFYILTLTELISLSVYSLSYTIFILLYDEKPIEGSDVNEFMIIMGTTVISSKLPSPAIIHLAENKNIDYRRVLDKKVVECRFWNSVYLLRAGTWDKFIRLLKKTF